MPDGAEPRRRAAAAAVMDLMNLANCCAICPTKARREVGHDGAYRRDCASKASSHSGKRATGFAGTDQRGRRVLCRRRAAAASFADEAMARELGPGDGANRRGTAPPGRLADTAHPSGRLAVFNCSGRTSQKMDRCHRLWGFPNPDPRRMILLADRLARVKALPTMATPRSPPKLKAGRAQRHRADAGRRPISDTPRPKHPLEAASPRSRAS